jgi:hypothetical protein
VTRIFGTGAAGPVVVTIACVGMIAMLFLRRIRYPAEPAPAVSE